MFTGTLHAPPPSKHICQGWADNPYKLLLRVIQVTPGSKVTMQPHHQAAACHHVHCQTTPYFLQAFQLLSLP